MLKKTSAATGLMIITAAGALLASSPAYALDGLVHGSHASSHHRSHHRNHNWNGNRHHGRIFIRIYIYNKNNNHAVAVARPERRRREAGPMDGVARREPVTVARQEPAPPAVTDVTPANTTPDQGYVAPAPAQAPPQAQAPAMDENATGNVSP